MSNIDSDGVEHVPGTVEINGELYRVKDYSLSEAAYLAKLAAKGLNPDGTEINDGLPLEPPVGFVKQISMVDLIRQQVRSEQLRLHAELAGYETFDDADDFGPEDEADDSPVSRYVIADDELEPVHVLRGKLRQAEERERSRARKKVVVEPSTEAGEESDEDSSGEPAGALEE